MMAEKGTTAGELSGNGRDRRRRRQRQGNKLELRWRWLGSKIVKERASWRRRRLVNSTPTGKTSRDAGVLAEDGERDQWWLGMAGHAEEQKVATVALRVGGRDGKRQQRQQRRERRWWSN
ncbi:hypothetical protein M0R45_001102 [Rubus argutus]|uniref:Uncharacterized protein n=1 Tax=Rubus argutus TaxID=59490 RepID=A0AAW1VN56_RUBAR